MEAKLVVVSGKAQANEFELTLPAILGRSRSADLPLNHPLVSRQHCELFESDGHLMVRDLGSLNGTFVGDSRINDEMRLAPGGLLTVGSFTFKAVYDGAPLDDETADFLVTEANGELEEMIGHADPDDSTASAPPAASSGSGISLSWLNDDEEAEQEAAEAPAPTDDAEAAEADLEPPPGHAGMATDDDDETAVEEPVARVKRKAAKASPPPRPARAAAAAEEPNEFAPPEPEHEAAHEGQEDLDDFFRSLQDP